MCDEVHLAVPVANGDLNAGNDTFSLPPACRDESMALSEKRDPRESFTKKLVRICQRLDEQAVRTITHKHIYREFTCQIEITMVWAVGSYARGALLCGDLDLVIGYEKIEGVLPSPRIWGRAFFGSPALVRYYSGNPIENTSSVSFSEAVPIWTGSECDWKAAVASIKPDPQAGRATRETDPIQLRDDQPASPEVALGLPPEQAELIKKTQAQAMENVYKMMSPYTITGGDKAKSILRQMLAGQVLKFRTVGINQAASTTGEVVLDESLAQSLRIIGIDPKSF